MEELLAVLRDSVTVSPEIRARVPVLKGTDVPVAQILAELAWDMSLSEVAEALDLDEDLLFILAEGLAKYLAYPPDTARQPPKLDPDFTYDLFVLMARHDMQDQLFYSVPEKDGPMKFQVNCSDTFMWGCADAEEMTPENLPALAQAFADTVAVDSKHGELSACDLYAARRRKMRPQGAAYPENKALWPLFDACGPERETEIGNPYRPGEYKKKQRHGGGADGEATTSG